MTNFSPARGARPLGANVLRNDSNSGPAKLSTDRCHAQAVIGETRNPSRAYSIAASNNRSNGSSPNCADSSTHAETAPGTVTLCQPRSGISVKFARYQSTLQLAGE